MRVRTIRKHDNAYGEDYTKNVGRIYDHPSPDALISGGVVEDAAKATARSAAEKKAD